MRFTEERLEQAIIELLEEEGYPQRAHPMLLVGAKRRSRSSGAAWSFKKL
jgi:hypothetical protein